MASGSAIRAGRAFVEAYLDTTRLERGLKSAQRRLQSFGAGVARIGGAITGIGASALAPLALATRQFAKTGDELHKMSSRTGASVEALSELSFVAEQSGQDITVLEKGFKGMARTLYDAERGLSTAVDALDDIGVSLDDVKGLKPEDQFTMLADRIGAVEDPTRRAGIAMKIFGRAGTDLLPLFNEGAGGISKLREQAREFGLTVGTDDANAAAALTDALNLLWRVVKRGVFAIGAGLAPVITELAMRIARIGSIVAKWVDQNRGLVVTIAKVAAGVFIAGTVITGLGIAIIGLGAVLGAAATVVGFMGSALTVLASVAGFLLSPIGLVIAAVVGLGVWLLKTTDIASKASDWLGRKFGALAKIATDAFGAIRDSLAAGDIQSAADVMWASLNLIWVKGTTGIERLWIKTKASILGIWRTVQQSLAGMFLKTIGALQKAWAGFSGFVRKRWADDQNVIAKGAVAVMGFFDKSIDVEGAQQILDEQHAAKVSGIDEETAKRHTEIEDGLRDQLDTLAEMGAEGDAAALGKHNRDLAEAGKGLADAEAAFQNALKGSSQSAAGAADGASNPLAALLESLTGGGLQTAQAAAGGGGTFSGMAARMFGGGQDVAKMQLTAMQKVAAHTEKIEKNSREGGMVFAP